LSAAPFAVGRLGNEGRIVLFQKTEDTVFRCGEGVCELRVRGMADYDQQGNSVLNDCCELVGFVSDAAIVSDGYPATLTYFLQPDRVGTIMMKMICVPLYVQTGGGQDFREALSEVAVSEKNATHAARS
jgi:hypothetical protein